ncbi:uncharacterized protein LOC122066407 [Macadamia integrifolia]|uniref:uncharacterized protein LOC122066407 n=1 Tax=Macadamia integrifolia TaxID=60698 RepID=UPI001C4F725D|nr:uncharacterized protein LOC122066407 [Macadamia integrifolia]
MAVYWWPSSMVSLLEKWMRNFIWTGDVDTLKAIIVKWDKVYKPKEEGGLGIRRLRDVNLALLAKQSWNIKHGSSRMSDFLKARHLGVDKWLGDLSIKEQLNPEESFFSDFNLKVAVVISNFSFPLVSSLFMQNVFTTAESINLPQCEVEDRCMWSCTSSGVFSSASAWNEIRRRNPKVHWYSLIWKAHLQPRQALFGWRVVNGKLPTDDLIKLKGVFLPSQCSLSQSAKESIFHIFLQCSFSMEIWKNFLKCFGVSWNSHASVLDLAIWWKRKQRGLAAKEPWLAGFVLILDNIWKERNDKRYEQRMRSPSLVFKLVKSDLQEVDINLSRLAI